MNAIEYDLDERQYHAHSALSSTQARLLLEDGGPAKYDYARKHPRTFDASNKFDIGHAVHSKVLGAGSPIVVIDADSWRTKAAQEARDEARRTGKAPLLKGEADLVDAMAEAVLANPTAAAHLERDGRPEVSLFATINGVDVRARFDYLPEPSNGPLVAVDLKTTFDASKTAFEKSVATYEYAVQRAWYLDTYKAVTGDHDTEMVFIAVQKNAPHLVAVYQLPTTWAMKGHEMAARAREIYAECTANDVWPGLPNEVVVLDEPLWHIYATDNDIEIAV